MCTIFKKVFIESVTVLVLFYVLFVSALRHVGSQLPVVAAQSLSCVPLFVTPWTVAPQACLSMRFSRKYWSGLPCPPLGDLPDPGIEPESLSLQHFRQILYHLGTPNQKYIHP